MTADPQPDQTRTRPKAGVGLAFAIAALVVIAVAVGTVVVLRMLQPEDTARFGERPVREPEGRQQAIRTCDGVDRLVELVEENAKADVIVSQADAVVALGLTAFQLDATWLPLASGVQAVRKGLADNLADATRTGMDTVRAECRRARDGHSPV